MSPRYLLLVADDDVGRQELVLRLFDQTGLEPAFASERIVALVNPACRCIDVGNSGCILGTLFHRHGAADPVARLTESDASSISRSRGQALVDRYWGAYIAAVASPDSVRVLRDPSGTFSSYFLSRGDTALFASDADLLVKAGAAVDVDYEEIGRQLYRANVPAAATALRGIRELLGGHSLALSGVAHKQEPCWSPWEHVAPRQEEPETATERLRRTVRHCIASWASTSRHVLLSVSGGLDSSVIAACLANAPAETTCITMYADDPAGDERIYARALCERLGFRLIERRYRLDDIVIEEPLAPHLPRPRDRTQANAYERVHLEAAREIGADAFMTGNGGDNVFGYSQSAAPVADRYLTEGIRAGTLQSLFDVCRQTGCSMFDALGQAWRLAHGTGAHRVQPRPMFLNPEFAADLGSDDLRHPWLDAPHGALPGKAAHISSVLRAQPTLEAARGFFLPMLSPLMSQPIIEACFGIPTWRWRADGRDRSVVRRAFAPELPPLIVERRVKGTPSRFAARLLDHFRAPIRERLLGGRLAAERIIDPASLGRVLEGDRPVPDLERVRILELVNVEAWIEHWHNRSPPPPQGDLSSGGVARPSASVDPIP